MTLPSLYAMSLSRSCCHPEGQGEGIGPGTPSMDLESWATSLSGRLLPTLHLERLLREDGSYHSSKVKAVGKVCLHGLDRMQPFERERMSSYLEDY